MLARDRALGPLRGSIVQIEFQNKIRGLNTDDFAVTYEGTSKTDRRKLLCQVKTSIAFAQGNDELGNVLQDAWSDFNNKTKFSKDKDAIALITGPLSALDQESVSWLLEQVRSTNNDDEEFFQRLNQANFSSHGKREKFRALQHHLNMANQNKDVPFNEVCHFLRHFHLIGCDLENPSNASLYL